MITKTGSDGSQAPGPSQTSKINLRSWLGCIWPRGLAALLPIAHQAVSAGPLSPELGSCREPRPTRTGLEPTASRCAVCRSRSRPSPGGPPRAHCRRNWGLAENPDPPRPDSNRPHPAARSAGLAPGPPPEGLREPTVAGSSPTNPDKKNPHAGGFFYLGRLTGLEPATPGITRKVSKLRELVVVRVRVGVAGAAPHIHHTVQARAPSTWAGIAQGGIGPSPPGRRRCGSRHRAQGGPSPPSWRDPARLLPDSRP